MKIKRGPGRPPKKRRGRPPKVQMDRGMPNVVSLITPADQVKNLDLVDATCDALVATVTKYNVNNPDPLFSTLARRAGEQVEHTRTIVKDVIRHRHDKEDK